MLKDEDKWEKDNKHEKIESSISNIQLKQIKKIKEWEKAHPNYLKDEKLLNLWHDMIHKIMGPEDDITREKNKEMIKKNIGTTYIRFKKFEYYCYCIFYPRTYKQIKN